MRRTTEAVSTQHPTQPSPSAEAPAALRVRGLRKFYGQREVVRGIDLTAQAGQITAVLGPNGAGKTTTIESCEGLRTPDAGRIEVLGRVRYDSGGPRINPKIHQELRQRVGVMLQDGGLPKAPSARVVLTHVASLHANPWPVQELLERLDLLEVARTSVRRLSGGQAQRLALGCAVIGRPDLVFLDEPSAGLDPHARRMVWALIEELRQGGTSMVLTTHLMDEAQRLSDVVHILHRGAVAAVGTPQDLTGTPQLTVTLAPQAHPEEALRARRVLQEGGFEAAVAGSRTLHLPLPRHTTITTQAQGIPAQGIPAQGIPADLAGRVGSALSAAGFDQATLNIASRTLEDVFLELTGDRFTSADDANASDGGPE